MNPRISLIVPAHNEAAVIAQTLAPLRALAYQGKAEVIVVPNACTDQTAEAARAACPEAQILSTEVPGKANALNIAMTRAKGDAVISLDADLVLPASAVEILAAPLLDGRADATCGRMHVDLGGAALLVRLFYQGWALNPYHDGGKFGGVFGLSRAAVVRIFPLPPLTADDEYVSRKVAPARTQFCPAVRFTVFAPRTLRALFAIRKRSWRGTRALATAAAGRKTNAGAARTVLSRAKTQPQTWAGVAVYFAVILAARLAVFCERASAKTRWERDDTSRIARTQS